MEVWYFNKGAKSAIINSITLGLMDAGISMRDIMVSSNSAKLDGNFIAGLLFDNRYYLWWIIE